MKMTDAQLNVSAVVGVYWGQNDHNCESSQTIRICDVLEGKMSYARKPTHTRQVPTH